MSGDEDISEGEEYATPLTSDTTPDIPPSTAGAVEDDSHDSHSTTSQLIPEMPCLERSIPPDQAADSVSIEQDSEPDSDSEPSDNEQDTKSSAPPAPRRSARSTKAYLLCTMGRSIYTAQIFQNWLNLPDINKPCMFPAIK